MACPALPLGELSHGEANRAMGSSGCPLEFGGFSGGRCKHEVLKAWRRVEAPVQNTRWIGEFGS